MEMRCRLCRRPIQRGEPVILSSTARGFVVCHDACVVALREEISEAIENRLSETRLVFEPVALVDSAA
jgi:hypothetical protein